MGDALENQQEAQRSGSNETESNSIAEAKDGQTPVMKPSESERRSDDEKPVVRYDQDTRFWDENKEEPPDRDPIKHARFWEEKLQELRVRNAVMQHRTGYEAIQKQRQRYAEMQQRRANKTEAGSKTTGQGLDMTPSGSGEKAVVRYDRDTRFWEEKMQQERLREAEMRRSERVLRSTEETKGETMDMRPSGSVRRSDEKAVVRYDRETRFWEENREYLESGPGYIQENLQQQQERLRDAEMQQRRSRETESIFFQPKKNREYECSGSRRNEEDQQRRSHETEWRFQQQQRARGSPDLGYKRRRFDERRHDEHELYPTRMKKGVCHFYLEKGWCVYGSDCRYNHPTPDWRFDEGTQRRREFDEGALGSGSTWRFDEEREWGYGEGALEQRQRDNIRWWQRRREAPEDVRRQRDSTGRLSYRERERREEHRRR